jgi:hypothetical protein
LKNAPEAERIPVLTPKIISNSQININASTDVYGPFKKERER